MGKVNRRGWLKRLGAAVVVAVASPVALVSPAAWEKVKRATGYLTPEQADRFIEIVLDQSVLLDSARIISRRDWDEADGKIRFGRRDDQRDHLKVFVDEERPTNQDLIKKAKLTLKDIA